MNSIPTHIAVIFELTTVITLLLFYWTVRHSSLESVRKKSNIVLIGGVIWLSIQAVLALNQVYSFDTNVVPPKLILYGLLPNLLMIVYLFATTKGRAFMDSLPLNKLAYISIVRIPVEFVLLALFMTQSIPQIMTFEGRNFDIISGITAPIIAYWGLTKGKLSRSIILAWHFLCLALLLNIVLIGILSTPFPFQKFAFDQPNIAILYFPFNWLPSFIVPIVLFSHLVSIRQLSK